MAFWLFLQIEGSKIVVWSLQQHPMVTAAEVAACGLLAEPRHAAA
jgi:hypothetical protein